MRGGFAAQAGFIRRPDLGLSIGHLSPHQRVIYEFITLSHAKAQRRGGEGTSKSSKEQLGGRSMRTYTVKAGDTLGIIAARELGRSSDWAKLWRLNREELIAEQKQRLPEGHRHIGSPDMIFPGTILKLD
jgi:nucleoid-associated protein YgaU